MKVIKLNIPYIIEAVVRYEPQIGDIITFSAINEVSQVQQDFMIDWSLIHGRLTFEIANTAIFNAGEKFEISIQNDTTNQIIYLGKMIVVKEDTDIQNYTPSKQTTQRYK